MSFAQRPQAIKTKYTALIENEPLKGLWMELKDAKTVKQCLDIVTTDAYQEEITSSWENCLDEIFQSTEAELAGQPVKIVGFNGVSETVLATCRWKKIKLRVTIDSLVFKNLTKSQKLWLRAYLKWQGQGWGYYA